MTDESKKVSRGRRAGKPNHRSWNMRHRMEERGFDPVREFIDAYTQLDSPSAKIDSLLKLFAHLYPKLKEVERLPDDDPDRDVHESERSVEELEQLAIISAK